MCAWLYGEYSIVYHLVIGMNVWNVLKKALRKANQDVVGWASIMEKSLAFLAFRHCVRIVTNMCFGMLSIRQKPQIVLLPAPLSMETLVRLSPWTYVNSCNKGEGKKEIFDISFEQYFRRPFIFEWAHEWSWLINLMTSIMFIFCCCGGILIAFLDSV